MRRIAGISWGKILSLITVAALAGGAAGAAKRGSALKPLAAGQARGAQSTSAGAASVPSDSLADRIDRLVREATAGRLRAGVRVEALGPGGGLVYEHDSTVPLVPASNQKLIVSSAAMCLLPADFAYRTILGRRGKDLVVIGAGDPGFGDPRLAKRAGRTITGVFHEWAGRLKAAGVRRIEGDLVFDDYVFDLEHVHPKWPTMFNMQSWYTAPVGGLNFNDNCVDVVVQRGAAAGSPAVVTLIPNTPYCVVRNKAVTAGKGEPIVSRSGDGPVTISVSGQVSRSGSVESPLSIPIVDPGAFFASTLRTVLATEGIEVAGGTRRGRVREANGVVPADLEVLAVHEQRLPELLERMNTNSLNMCAEAMLKTLGAYSLEGRVVQQGSLATGRAAAAKFLGTLGLGSELYVLDDGSGLSRDNRAAAVVFARILKHMDGHPLRKVWWESLAEAGDADGSLKRRMKDLGERVCGKTGHINNVATLSGYVTGPGGRRYAFSVLCNDTSRAKGGTSAAHKLQDDLCRLLATAER